MSVELIVPTLGESITEATVSKWLKKIGESFEVDEPLVEIETDKGHDAFLLDEPEFHITLSGFLNAAAERRGIKSL